ncbi:nucleotide exchange factor GrpE [Candidatus Saccharibacteria bacterium]|nr:nucleotide exchange factor GrpE [Candidatus Saccharibacteria bacterium]
MIGRKKMDRDDKMMDDEMENEVQFDEMPEKSIKNDGMRESNMRNNEAPEADMKNKKMSFDEKEIRDLQAKNVASELKIQELTADLQRTRADFENYRKQIEMRIDNERKMAKEVTVRKMLPLIDDMDRAFCNYEAELGPVKKNFEKILNELGLKRIVSEKGTEFNPELHEAVMAEGDGEKEVIAETLRTGYYYDGEVLRAAMVKISRE